MNCDPKPYAGMNVCQVVEAIFLMPLHEREALVERCRELVRVPLEDEYIGWMEEGTSFGCCEVSRHRGPNGERVVIGFHA